MTTEQAQQGYNGWSNYETWLMATWLDNEQHTYFLWRDNAKQAVKTVLDENADMRDDRAELTLKAAVSLALQLDEWIDEENPLADQANVFADLLSTALVEVNHVEIARYYLEDDVLDDAIETWLDENTDEDT